jgi:tetratricopeptide (TPR) repeat protein
MILLNAGQQYLQLGKTELAIEILNLSKELFPYEPETYISLAKAFLVMGNPVKAVEYFKKTLEIDPGNPEAVRGLNGLKKR